MDRLFNVNNPLMRALSKLFDIGWLSLIYVVFCVPLVTIGASDDITVLRECQGTPQRQRICVV